MTDRALASIDGSGGSIGCLATGGALCGLGPSLARAGGPAVAHRPISSRTGWRWSRFRTGPPRWSARLTGSGGGAAPILYPGKVLCAGACHHAQFAWMGMTGVTEDSQRLFFLFKPARNAVVGEGETVHMPRDTTAFDRAIELAAVIGRPARAVRPEDALAPVAAFTVAIDFSARDLTRVARGAMLAAMRAAPVAAAAEVRLRMSSPAPPTAILSTSMEVFKAILGATAPGAFDVATHPVGTLFRQGTGIPAMQRGTRQVAIGAVRTVKTPADLAGIRLRMPGSPDVVMLDKGPGIDPAPTAMSVSVSP